MAQTHGLSPTSGYDRANLPAPGDEDAYDEERGYEDGEDISSWRKDFSDDWNASDDQRDKANEDMRFVMVQGGQWESWIGDDYASNRPRLEMDKVYERLNIFMAQYAEAAPGVIYEPATGSQTKKEQCQILNGLYRSDMRRDNGEYSLYNAVHEAAAGGVGAFRFRAKFEDEDDDENLNQVIHVEPIHAAYSSVIWDANAKRYDKRDARRCHVVTFMTTEAFEERFPGKSPSSVPAGEDRRLFNWNTPGGVYVAERYWVEEVIKTSVLLAHPSTGERHSLFEEEFSATIAEYDALGFEEIRRRKKTVRVVKKAIYSGVDMLEDPVEIAGKYIPIVPIYAYWMFLDGQEQYYGLVRKQKDPQRLFNMQASSLAELAATSVKEVPIFAPEQMVGPGIKELWSEAHLGNTNYLVAQPLRDESGQIISAGPLGYNKPPQVPPALASTLQLTSEYISSTGTLAPTELPNREVSGDAIKRITKRVDLKTYGIMENVFNSLVLAGDIYKEMAKEIYGDERTVSLVENDGRQREETINTMKANPDTGRMEAVNNIGTGRFECYADVGPSYASLREEAKDTYRELLQTMTPDSPYYSVIMTEFMSLLSGTSPTFDEFNRKQQLEQGLRQPDTPEEQQYMQQLQESRSQPSPQDQLVLAAAAKEQADAKKADADTQKTLAEVQETQADTAETMSQIPLNASEVALNQAKTRTELAEASGFSRVANVVQFPRTSQGNQ